MLIPKELLLIPRELKHTIGDLGPQGFGTPALLVSSMSTHGCELLCLGTVEVRPPDSLLLTLGLPSVTIELRVCPMAAPT